VKHTLRYRFRRYHLGAYVALMALLLCTCLPMISMVGNAFKDNKQLIFDRSLIPSNPSLASFQYVYSQTKFPSNLANSLIAALCVTVVCVCAACLAGYALSRFQGRAFSAFKATTYAFQMIPVVLLLIPMFMIIKTIGLYNNLLSIIVCYTAISLPLAIWIMKGFFDTIPFEIEESALIDGASQFRSFRSIILPIARPGIMTAATLTFVYAWNEYMLANIFIQAQDKTTLTVGLAQFAQQNSADYGYQMAAASLASIPAAILLVFAQRYIVSGLSAGAVKG